MSEKSHKQYTTRLECEITVEQLPPIASPAREGESYSCLLAHPIPGVNAPSATDFYNFAELVQHFSDRREALSYFIVKHNRHA